MTFLRALLPRSEVFEGYCQKLMFFRRRRRVAKKELLFLGAVAKQCRLAGAAGELPKSNVFGAPRGQCQKVAFFERRCQGVTFSPKVKFLRALLQK